MAGASLGHARSRESVSARTARPQERAGEKQRQEGVCVVLVVVVVVVLSVGLFGTVWR